MNARSTILRAALTAATVLLATPGSGLAQGVSVYSPMAEEYTIGDFRYRPPSEDGWRQITSLPGMFILVYAESLGEDQVNTRAQVVAESHPVPAEQREKIPGVEWLAQQSFAQQTKEREEKLVAYSPLRAVGDTGVQAYALVTKEGEEDLFENFYVALAPDNSSYLVAKLATKEQNYREEPFLAQFEASLASVEVPQAAADDAAGEEAAAPDPSGGGEAKDTED